MSGRLGGVAALAWLACCAGGLASAAGEPGAASIPAPQDRDYPGTVRLAVDATDVEHRVYDVRESIPVAGPGPLVLLYPRWLPGNHSTTGPIDALAGLQISTADGRPVEWRRDAELMHAFHVEVPAGADVLLLRFQFVTPVVAEQGRRVVTPDVLGVQWEKSLLYPAGYYASRIPVVASVRLPAGWQFATALDGAVRAGDEVSFAPASLEHLVDSPLFAGRYYRRYELGSIEGAPVRLNVFADRPERLEATPRQLDAHRRLVQQAGALFGSRHFAHYDFLLALSGSYGGIGLEHHQSSENATEPGYFRDWDATAPVRDLLPHEMTHSWNGKFRRPADLWTPSYEVPMHTSLLWVYEGMTEYWGTILAARSGLWSVEFTRDALAHYAATYSLARPGRSWRDLQDTTNQPVIAYRTPQNYTSWQRGKDYYTEGALVWLDADTRIREATGGRRSLDDFVRGFVSMRDGELGPLTYTIADVVEGLQSVAPGDWSRFLRDRLDGHGPGAPLDGLRRGGWTLAFGPEPSAYTAALDTQAKQASFTFSLGITVENEGGRIADVVWGSPAFAAGVGTGMTLVAVNGRAYGAELLRDAVTAARSSRDPIELLVRQDDTYRTLRVDYHEGLRYPRLERLPGTPDRLGAILAPRR